jgi:hypothetical protein
MGNQLSSGVVGDRSLSNDYLSEINKLHTLILLKQEIKSIRKNFWVEAEAAM